MEQGSSKYQHHNTGYVVEDRGDTKNEDGKPKTPKKEKWGVQNTKTKTSNHEKKRPLNMKTKTPEHENKDL